MKILKKIIRWLLIAAAALAAAVVVLNLIVVLSTAGRIVSREEAASFDADCVLVLGCGVLADGSPSAMLADRLDEGIALYELGAGKKLLMSGDHGRKYYNEVAAMQKRAEDAGVPPEDVFLDHAGFSTYDSLYRASAVFGVKKCVIVTQRYHLYRALYAARAMGIEAVGVASDPRAYRGALYFGARECAARVKDFGMCLFHLDPVMLGEPIPISGSGLVTRD
ncbi:MAG: YdcF family protein [Oscillospiraceae bacterium]|nr:YdcF family protein [Oscillospiraceae bacterium]